MKEFKVTVKVENVFNFFNDDYKDVDYFIAVNNGYVKNHEIADCFVDAIKNGEVKNFKYNVDNVDVKKLKKGDYNFSFEMKGHKYVMDPEMSPEFAIEIIEEFQRAAFKYIHKKPEKLNHILEKFKNDRTLEDEFTFKNGYILNYYTYDVETKFFIENGEAYKYIDYGYLDFNNVDEEDVTNDFVFTWYDNSYMLCTAEEMPDRDWIIEKNGGVKFYVAHNDYDFEGNFREISKRSYMYMKDLVEVQLPKIRKIVTETYFEEKEEINEEK